MASGRNKGRNSGSARSRKRNLELARVAQQQQRREQDAKRKRQDRLGEGIVKWEEKIDALETALEPWRHQKWKQRTKDQITMKPVVPFC